MKKQILLSLLSLGILTSVQAAEKTATPVDAKAADPFKLIHAKDLSMMMANKKLKVAVFDANNEQTRAKNGSIPGAVLLTNYKTYDLAQLPSDPKAKQTTQLVFYCANPGCMASHEAALKATQVGFKKVSVMADGIEGWKTAGLPTTLTKTN